MYEKNQFQKFSTMVLILLQFGFFYDKNRFEIFKVNKERERERKKEGKERERRECMCVCEREREERCNQKDKRSNLILNKDILLSC
jgi:hypothetical protein